MTGVPDDSGQRGQVPGFLADHQGRRAIVDLGAVALGDRAAVFFKNRVHEGDLVEIFRERLFVHPDHAGLSPVVHGNLHDFLIERTGFVSGEGPGIAPESVGVLMFPGITAIAGDPFAQLPHVPVFVGIPQPVVNQAVDDLGVSQFFAAPHLGQEIRRLAHAFHPAGDHEVGFLEPDHLVRQDHRLESRPANLVDGRRPDAFRQPAFEGRLAGGGLADSGGDHVSQDHFLNLIVAHAASAKRFPDGRSPQFRSRQGRQRSLKGPYGGPHSAVDERGFFRGGHARPPSAKNRPWGRGFPSPGLFQDFLTTGRSIWNRSVVRE